MKQILVAVDGSAESKAAVKLAGEIAAGVRALVRVVCVVPPYEAFNNVVASPEEKAAQRASATTIASEAAREIAGAPVETEITEGMPADAIATVAMAPEIGLVVVGHRGRGRVARLLIGSVADRLVQISPKPVLVVR